MGACSFTDVATGDSPEHAYAIAVQRAQHDQGHNTYNGTISTTSGFRYKPFIVLNPTDKDIQAWVEDAWNGTVKWGDCWCARLPDGAMGRKSAPEGQASYIFAGWAAE